MLQRERIGYFGYGSLVNRETLRTSHLQLLPARLKGWRRHWQCREHHPDMTVSQSIALLSIHPHVTGELAGMLVIDDAANLPHVDLREAFYDRVPIQPSDLQFADDEMARDLPETLFVYVGRPAQNQRDIHLLQSYLDAVLTGYLREFGENGLSEFLETTVGFERPIVRDRLQPRYPRAVSVELDLARRFDDLLRGAGVVFD